MNHPDTAGIDIATVTTVRTFQKLGLTIGFGRFVLIALATAINNSRQKGNLTIEARAVLCGGLAVFLLGLSAVQWAAPRSLPGQVIGVRVLAALGCAVLVWLGCFLAPLILTGVLTATVVSLVVFESSRLGRITP